MISHLPMNPLADRQATINLTKPSSVSCRNPEKTNNTTDQTLIYNVYDLGQSTAGEFSGSCSTVKLILETPLTYIVCSLCNFFYIILLGGMVVRNTDCVHVHACTMLYETHAVKHHCPTWLEIFFAANTMGFSLRGLLHGNLPICYAFCNRTSRKHFTRSQNTIYHNIYQFILLMATLNKSVIIRIVPLLQLLTLTAHLTSNSFMNRQLIVKLLLKSMQKIQYC